MSITIEETEVDKPGTGFVEEPEVECEYCIEPGKEVITKHGLSPAEELPDGRRMHRMIHLMSCEARDKSIPCPLCRVKTLPSRYSWTGHYEKTTPTAKL